MTIWWLLIACWITMATDTNTHTETDTHTHTHSHTHAHTQSHTHALRHAHTHTLRSCNTDCFPPQHWLHERASMLLYTRTLLVLFCTAVIIVAFAVISLWIHHCENVHLHAHTWINHKKSRHFFILVFMAVRMSFWTFIVRRRSVRNHADSVLLGAYQAGAEFLVCTIR
jgi:uncharacterized iron-regulated membrane protein